MIWLGNVVAGGLAGLLCAIGGAIKDSPHEDFNPDTFMRSPVVGLVCGALTIPITNNWLIAFCVAGYFERIAVEGWKIVRHQKPGKHSWRYSEWPALWSGQKPIEQDPPVAHVADPQEPHQYLGPRPFGCAWCSLPQEHNIHKVSETRPEGS